MHVTPIFTKVAKFLVLCLAAAPVLSDAAELAVLGNGDYSVDACLINVRKDAVRLFWHGSDGLPLGTFRRVQGTLHKTNERLVCASNAGIYDQDLRPLGLYVETGRVLRKLNARKVAYGNFYVQPNGVFILTANSAEIFATDKVTETWMQLSPTIRYATQSGPLLLQSGQINPIFTQRSESRVIRNAVCTKSSTDIALVKSRMPINFYNFAQTLRDEVGCRDALYLDGVISQLYPIDSGDMAPKFGPMIGVVVATPQ